MNFTVDQEKAVSVILTTYEKALEAIRERAYSREDVTSISCWPITEYLVPATLEGSLLGFVLSLELRDGQEYRKMLRLRCKVDQAESAGLFQITPGNKAWVL